MKTEKINKLIEIFGKEKRWVNWKYEKDDKGRDTKIPYQIDGVHKASSINPATWSTYDEAEKSLQNIGIIFTPDQTLLGIDIDHCLEDNQIPEEIRLFVELANTYTEVSPSGKGLHLYIKLTGPLKLLRSKKAPYELYTSGRFFTVSQKVWGEEKSVRIMSPEEVIKLLETIDYPWENTDKIDTYNEKQITSSNLDDASILDKMFDSKNGDKIYALYNSDISKYNDDDSSADMALCSHLAFWTGHNAPQMERIWQRSPLGQRKKTQTRRDYRERTIKAVIRGSTEIYKPSEAKIIEQHPTPSFCSALSHAELISRVFLPARYTLEPFFEQGTMDMVSAPPNTWKSWLLFLIAGHIANGTSVFGKFATEKANVMIVNEEDSARLVQDRLRLLKMTDPALPIYYRIANGSKLTEDFINSLINEAKEKNIGVIMFDSLRAIHSANENDSTEMQVVLDLLKKITRANITVIFTHHHRKKSMNQRSDDAESTRGTSAINAAISGHISLEEVDKEDTKYLIVKHLKSKVGEKLPPFDVGIKINEDLSVDFQYLGEHQPKEQALTEAKSGILYELENRIELLGRKDFQFLKIAGATSIKEATKSLEKEGKIKVITRKEAEKSGLKTLSPGKANEKLYFLDKEDSDFDAFNQPNLEDSV
jgi:hypothetical protein